MLKNEEQALAYSTFAVYVASIFSKFVVPLQTSTPMIHNLYSMCQDLVTSLCQMFSLDDKYSKVNKNGTKVLKSISDLAKLEFEDKENHKVNNTSHFLIEFIALRWLVPPSLRIYPPLPTLK